MIVWIITKTNNDRHHQHWLNEHATQQNAADNCVCVCVYDHQNNQIKSNGKNETKRIESNQTNKQKRESRSPDVQQQQ